MRRTTAFILCSALLVAAAAARASERSERLVASGEDAYRDGRWDEAEARFREAVAADPDDAVARYDLGLALVKRARWEDAIESFEAARRLRPGFDEADRALDVARARASESQIAAAATKRWELRGTTGWQYDSNVKVAPGGRVGSGTGDRDDVAFVVGAGAQYDFVRRSDAVVRLEYDLYQTLHPDVNDFDFRSQRIRGTASGQIHQGIWAGLQGGYDHYSLGTHAYLSEPWFMPFLSLVEGDRGLTQFTYRHGEDDYLSAPFDRTFNRDGPADAVGGTQTFFSGPRSLSVGYQYEEARPRSASGADFAFDSNQFHVGVSFPAWWQTDVDLVYLFRYDNYTARNSQADFRKRRHDPAHEFSAGISRPIVEHVRAALLYYGTLNNSNVPVFDYDRHIVSAVLQFTY